MTKDPSNFREYAGTLVAMIIIIAYLAIGFVQIALFATLGTVISVPQDWNTTMQSLANIALGYLIGKQTVGTGPTVNVPVGDTTTTTVNTSEKAANGR